MVGMRNSCITEKEKCQKLIIFLQISRRDNFKIFSLLH